ncbi:MAG: fibrobacter succinogenes major paralogous domain-containing protein [Prevotellaceae bacterium]|nr:fibrobacter succinogenes major paralogous domain-containing protein [Prevotellaceae bacterium]
MNSVGGYYWSSGVNNAYGRNLLFSSTDVYPTTNGARAAGFSVRCVAEVNP